MSRRGYVFDAGFTSVAAAILAAVEGGILPPGPALPHGVALSECAIETTENLKVADVAWASRQRWESMADRVSCSVAWIAEQLPMWIAVEDRRRLTSCCPNIPETGHEVRGQSADRPLVLFVPRANHNSLARSGNNYGVCSWILPPASLPEAV